jgi:lantibiotic modifying enzyme
VDKSISHYFKQPSYQHMLSHIQALGEADLARQLAIIQGSFHAQVARTTNENNHKWQVESLPLLCQEQLIAEARAIASPTFTLFICKLTEIQQKTLR